MQAIMVEKDKNNDVIINDMYNQISDIIIADKIRKINPFVKKNSANQTSDVRSAEN